MYLEHSKIPPIAVVMATYNGASFLVEQIESILAQTLKPTLFIVCDDCSTDDTHLILQKYQEQGSLVWYRNETRVGVVANFKYAISIVPPGYYFTLADQDDIWYPHKLATCMDAMRLIEDTSRPAMVYSDLSFIDATGKTINPSFRNELGHDKYVHCLDTLCFGNFVLGCTTLCNESMKSFIADLPINKNFNHDAWMAMVAFGLGNAHSIKEPLVAYRQHGQNVTISGHKKNNLLKRYWQHLRNIVSYNNYLSERFLLVRLFLDKYKALLSPESLEKLEAFLNLEDKSYLAKKLAFEKVFMGKWIKRF